MSTARPSPTSADPVDDESGDADRGNGAAALIEGKGRKGMGREDAKKVVADVRSRRGVRRRLPR
jgi:hypothetical protein